MKCCLCANDILSIESNTTLCIQCKRLNRSDLFSKILATLLEIYSANKDFEVIKDKCAQFNAMLRNYPLFITPYSTFDVEEHDTDRIALHYLRNNVISEDNYTLQKQHPVKIDAPNNGCLYKTIAMLCRLDIDEGAKELRVRNVIDMVLNAEMYHLADPDLHSCLQWGDTWRYFVLEQLREKPSVIGLNAVLTLLLHSLSNIINMRIRSVYPKVPGGNDDLQKRLNRIFSPLDIQLNATTVLTITILWSNMKHISSHSTSSMWMPDCVVPLLPKPDSYANDALSSPRASSASLQNPAERSFYILSCLCPITQSALNEVVSYIDQQKHSEAEMKKEDAKVPEFSCPKCSKPCDNYRFDWTAVALFRQNFNGARLTYILVDTSSSMTFHLLNTKLTDKKPSLSRISQTKEAIKQLLKEIASAADPLDQAILTTFDNKLKKPAVIPLCQAMDIANESNLDRIDDIQLSPRSIDTYFYAVLREVYEMFERQPYLYIDLYLFSDGVDTSSKKNDRTYQAIIRGLNEKIGAKCHFMNCGSASEGFSVAGWLGDRDADCPVAGNIDEIKAQVRAIYQKDHARNPDLTSTAVRFRGKSLTVPQPTLTTFLTDAEAASILKPRQTVPSNDEPVLTGSFFCRSNPNLKKDFNDYLTALPSAARPRSATTSSDRSKSPDAFKIVTRNLNARKRNLN